MKQRLGLISQPVCRLPKHVHDQREVRPLARFICDDFTVVEVHHRRKVKLLPSDTEFGDVDTAHAANGRVMAFDASKEDVSNAVEILPQSDLILSDRDVCGVVGAQDALYVYGVRKGSPVIVRIPYDNPSQREEIPMPAAGDLSDVSADYRVPGIVFTVLRTFRSSLFYVYDPAKKISVQLNITSP